MNSRQHLEPIEFEEMSRQLRQRSRGKESNSPLRERRTFAFCLRAVAFGVDDGKRGT